MNAFQRSFEDYVQPRPELKQLANDARAVFGWSDPPTFPRLRLFRWLPDR